MGPFHSRMMGWVLAVAWIGVPAFGQTWNNAYYVDDPDNEIASVGALKKTVRFSVSNALRSEVTALEIDPHDNGFWVGGNAWFTADLQEPWLAHFDSMGKLLSIAQASRPGHAEAPAPPAPQAVAKCATPEHRQFDFWVGDWDAYDAGKPDKVVARNRVDRILDGCALREVYEQTDGLVGQSFSVYDASRKVWHQSWVTNHGQLLTIEGRFENGRMTLAGTQRIDGHEQKVRAVWYRGKDGEKDGVRSVRETAESSADGGKTWKPMFDIVFQPHRP